VFYASAFAMASGIFISRYRVELALAVPLVAYAMAYYMHLGFKKNSPVQHPEQLFFRKKLMVIVGVTFAACAALLFIIVPVLEEFFPPLVGHEQGVSR